MSNEDKEVFEKGRPYIVGAVALAMLLTRPKYVIGEKATPIVCKEGIVAAFDDAEDFVAEFEKRNP